MDDFERAARLRVAITDPQFESYDLWAHAWASLSAGDYPSAASAGLRAIEVAPYFKPLVLPLVARAGLWAGDPGAARATMEQRERAVYRGQALALDRSAIAAGIAASEGRSAEALALYREALRGWRAARCAWDEALTVIDMLEFLGPHQPEVQAAAAWARATLTRLGARPFLERLDRSLTAAAGGESGGGRRREGAAQEDAVGPVGARPA
ncbi:MAG: hypothetical protein ABIZ34_08755 [Candidatus Limnocylindrales bacterium]